MHVGRAAISRAPRGRRSDPEPPPRRAGARKDAAETAAETNPTAGARAHPADRVTRDLIPLRCCLTIVFPLLVVCDVDEMIHQRESECAHGCELG